jgi:hypothetical protein
MADISKLARLINGTSRNVDLSSNALVVNTIKVGGTAVPAVKASRSTQGLTFTAKTAGVVGNGYSVTVVDILTGLSYTEVLGEVIIDLGGTTPTTAQVVTLLAGSSYVDVVEVTPGSVIAASELFLINGAEAYTLTELTKAILDKLILINGKADADGSFDLQYADIAIEAVANAALPSASFTDAAVTGKLLTGYSSSAGLVAAGDTLLVGINKLNGNSVNIKATADAALPAANFTDSAVTSKLITGFSTTTGALLGTDTILQAINKLDGNIGAAIVGAIIYKGTFAANAEAAAVKASLITQGLTFSAKTAGVAGNAYRFTVVDSTGSGPLSYTEVAGNIILDLVGLSPTTAQVVTHMMTTVPSAFVDVVESTPGTVGTATILPFTGGLDAVGPFDAINNPKQGWLYKVSVAGTIDGRLYSINDNMYVNKDVVGHPVSADIDLIDNTEAADLLRKGMLTDGKIFVGSVGNEATSVSMSGEASIIASGAVTLANSAIIGKVLTGFSSGAGSITVADSILSAFNKLDGNVVGTVAVANAALPAASFTDSAVTSKLITGFSSGAGALAVGDTILQAINKLDGNIAAAIGGDASSVVENMSAGETFAANSSFLVRLAKVGDAGYAAGRVYKADRAAGAEGAETNTIYVIGLAQNKTGSAITAGNPIPVVKLGMATLQSSDTAFEASEVGLPVYLASAGAFDVYSQITFVTNDANVWCAQVKTTSTIEVKQAQIMGIEG